MAAITTVAIGAGAFLLLYMAIGISIGIAWALFVMPSIVADFEEKFERRPGALTVAYVTGRIAIVDVMPVWPIAVMAWAIDD